MADHPAVPGGTAPHVIVSDIAAPALRVDDHHHLERVLRLRPGAPVSVTDGAGSWRWCRFGPELIIDGEVEHVPAPAPPITVAFALVKGQKPELVVQKLTELGVDEIIPFVAERSVVRWDEERSRRNTERLRRVAAEAAMQSRRVWLPEVQEVTTFDELAVSGELLAADRDGAAPTLARPAVMIGPEGGWSESERARFAGTVGLGPSVLRAETAAFAAAAMLGALRAGLVAPAARP
ncbi:MAG: RsmE family RNA methyltransferase [Actinobacteria bacterium]|uniref:16S rRNA (uracil(1498)-N(3))-methyltransferase n=1 Tax=freshwater metagenome TaxID=449393 RepID=A0A6J7JA69_9ZZZZ|nr:RsmE family RNA methyltransferase [Actinomycetota bacterium]